MIVIPRREGQGIVIGDEIIVNVIEVQDDKVRLIIERLPDSPGDESEITEVVSQEEQVPLHACGTVARPRECFRPLVFRRAARHAREGGEEL
jgi:carbon storage regulator